VRSARLWSRLLGLVKAVVEGVEFDELEQVIIVSVRPGKAAKRRCGRCGMRCPGYDQGQGRRRWRALDRLCWVMETSMLKTLAGKHGSSVSKMAARFKVKIQTPHGPRTCFEASLPRDSRRELVARFGGIPLRRQKTAVLTDRLTGPVYPHKELISRLLVNRCELCQKADEVQVHQVRSLVSLATPGTPQPQWAQWMASHRRKTLVVCGDCHDLIHHGQTSTTLTQ
jgi:hypothetical protein